MRPMVKFFAMNGWVGSYATTSGKPLELIVMFAWLKEWLAQWADGVMQRQIDRRLEKTLRLKTEI